jgi:hypothetical protein
VSSAMARAWESMRSRCSRATPQSSTSATVPSATTHQPPAATPDEGKYEATRLMWRFDLEGLVSLGELFSGTAELGHDTGDCWVDPLCGLASRLTETRGVPAGGAELGTISLRNKILCSPQRVCPRRGFRESSRSR